MKRHENLVPLSILKKRAKKYTPEVDDIIYANDNIHKYIATVGKRHIKFGSIFHSDYLIHKDKERRKRYRARHKHDNIDKIGPGRLSWYILW